MRKVFLLVVSLVVALTACQKEEAPFAPDGANTQTITISIPQGMQSRAVGTYANAADYGKAVEINRCILQVYREGVAYGDPMVVEVQTSENKKTATFNLRLVAQQKYDFVFWADCATETNNGTFSDLHYNTSDLTNITVIGDYVGNNDEFDAFFFCKTDYTVTESFAETSWVLRRPFGQLNVKTNDMTAIPDNTLKPTKVKVALTALPTSFNAKTGTVGEQTANVEYEAKVINQANGELTVDYIWAPVEEAALVNFSMKFYNNETLICENNDFKNIPVRRNYKTNVSGNLLTKQGTINVTIDPDFEQPDIEQEIVEVATVADVTEAIKNGATTIIVKEAPTSDAAIEIPHTLTEEQAAKELSISLPTTNQQVTIQYTTEQTGAAPKTVNITAPNTNNLVIELPQSTVTLNGANYNEVSATTADNTLIIPEDVTIETLIVKKGNVEIYGTDNKITLEEGAGIVKTYAVGDAETLKKAAELVANRQCAKIVLTADIDLKGSTDNLWTPINAENNVFIEFDGGNHTISNLYVNNIDPQKGDVPGYQYGGLFYVLQSTIKDLTIEVANVTCLRGGVLVGRMDCGTLENCHVKNTTVTSIQKVAGLVGFVSSSAKDVTIRNCSVDQCKLNTPNTDGIYQAGGLIGYLQSFDRNVLIEGNSVSGISFQKVYAPADSVKDKLYDLEQCYSHAFIGTIANYSADADAYNTYTIELRNNKVAEQITDIPTLDGRTDDYIGWWAGYYGPTGKAFTPKVVVDGVAKDCWVYVKYVYKQLTNGKDITIYQNCDLTQCSETKGTINIPSGTTLTVGYTYKDNKGNEVKVSPTLTVGQIANIDEINITGPGSIVDENGNTLYPRN